MAKITKFSTREIKYLWISAIPDISFMSESLPFISYFTFEKSSKYLLKIKLKIFSVQCLGGSNFFTTNFDSAKNLCYKSPVPFP